MEEKMAMAKEGLDAGFDTGNQECQNLDQCRKLWKIYYNKKIYTGNRSLK